jgi:hypothetical protein
MNASAADGSVHFIPDNINVGSGYAADRTNVQMIGGDASVRLRGFGSRYPFRNLLACFGEICR